MGPCRKDLPELRQHHRYEKADHILNGKLNCLGQGQKEKMNDIRECFRQVCSLVTKSCPTPVTPWTVAHQAPLSIGFSKQEYWCGLPFTSAGDLPNLGIKPGPLEQ